MRRNKALGNFKYAADQLTALIAKSLTTLPMAQTAALQVRTPLRRVGVEGGGSHQAVLQPL